MNMGYSLFPEDIRKPYGELFGRGTEGDSAKFGTVNPRDYTPESLQEFKKTGDFSSLERVPTNMKVVKIGGVEHLANLSEGTLTPLTTPEEIADTKAMIAAAEEQATGEQAAKTSVSKAVIQEGLDAAKGLPALKRTMQLLDTVETGGYDAFKLKAKKMFGIEGADEGELSGNLGKAVLSQLKATFGSAFTEKEGQRLETIEAGFGKSSATNYRLIGNLMQLVESYVEKGIKRAEDMGDTATADELRQALEMQLDPVVQQQTPELSSEPSIDDLMNLYGDQ
jgi:hypothetical protein